MSPPPPRRRRRHAGAGQVDGQAGPLVAVVIGGGDHERPPPPRATTASTRPQGPGGRDRHGRRRLEVQRLDVLVRLSSLPRPSTRSCPGWLRRWTILVVPVGSRDVHLVLHVDDPGHRRRRALEVGSGRPRGAPRPAGWRCRRSPRRRAAAGATCVASGTARSGPARRGRRRLPSRSSISCWMLGAQLAPGHRRDEQADAHADPEHEEPPVAEQPAGAVARPSRRAWCCRRRPSPAGTGGGSG